MPEQYTINVTGSGSKEDLLKALANLTRMIASDRADKYPEECHNCAGNIIYEYAKLES